MAGPPQLRLGKRAADAVAGRVAAAEGQDHAEDVECAVCSCPAFESPVQTVPCAHLYHRACLDDWLKDKAAAARTCPSCRKKLPKDAYKMADHVVKNILDKLNINCPQQCEGPNPKRMRYSELAAHITDQCPETPLLCSIGCGAVLLRKEMGDHNAKCEHALITCVHCQGQVQRYKLQAHNAEDCKGRLFTCVHCKQSGLLFAEKGAHELQCTGPVPMMELAKLRQQNEQLRQQNKELQQQNQQGVLKELQGMRKQQEAHQQSVAAFQARTDTTLRAVVQDAQRARMKMRSQERPGSNGEYVLRPIHFRGHCVWQKRKGLSCVFKGAQGKWSVAKSLKSMMADGRFMRSKGADTRDPVAATGWQVLENGSWVDAPGTKFAAA
eukprot:TRINITY_DN13353_c0_g2_i1.p1 TRINITY_DN13353_c0_g2~~TRINITY_DN13353_c0_g2_i1.p1  ORF type:complete len:382 (+),score=149.18 TRINITY_DN13353_c0_g2_i1:79-1224(+)